MWLRVQVGNSRCLGALRPLSLSLPCLMLDDDKGDDRCCEAVERKRTLTLTLIRESGMALENLGQAQK